MFNLIVNQQWLLGACFVFYAVYLYSSNPLQAPPKQNGKGNGKSNGKGGSSDGGAAAGESPAVRNREKSTESTNTQHEK